jgi:signal recognition particle subunit SRP54
MDDTLIRRQIAMIQSMTKDERRNPDILKASRKRRIAAGSGTEVQDVNRLLKMHRQMADLVKRVGRKGPKGLLRGGLGGLLGKGAGGAPGGATPPQGLGGGVGAPGGLPPGLGGLGGGGGGLPPGLSGFGSKKK